MTTFLLIPPSAPAQETLQWAGIFGSRRLRVESPNAPGTMYTTVQHVDSQRGYDNLAYDPARGWGFEVLYPDLDGPYVDPDRNSAGRFGPFDSSPNNRNHWPNTLPDELYDSFIGFKDFADTCDEFVVGDLTSPCSTAIDPDGGIFRIDVPNGDYRFVGVFGDADNHHAHRVLVEDGGSGLPTNLGPNHVVLVHNHNQPDYDIGQADANNLGEGVYALVGFDNKRPPQPQGDPHPVFVAMDDKGMPILDNNGVPIENAQPNSPTLKVTQGYIRIHLLQGNSNDGPGGGRDPNGGDIVLFEAWQLGAGILGDIDGDGDLDAADIDLLNDAIRTNKTDAKFDVNKDNAVNADDRSHWVETLKKTWFGDANLDGEFSTQDFVQVFQNGEYEDQTALNSTWAEGDWNGDGEFDSGDFVIAFQGGGFERGPRAATSAVPEPGSGTLILALVLLPLIQRRHTGN